MAFSYDFLPPIVPNILPAFTGNTAKLYFTLSQNSNNSLIKEIQYKIIAQDNGAKIFNTNNNSISSTQFHQCQDEEDLLYGDHYILIDCSQLKYDTFYKVQFRFSKTSTQTSIVDLNNYSEYSSICLIKRIYEPQIQIYKFSNLNKNSSATKQITQLPNPITGKMTYLGSKSELLKNIKFTIIENDTDKIIENSDYIYANDNNFSYTYKNNLIDGVKYNLIVNYITTSGYKGAKTFSFIQLSTGLSNNPAELYLTPNYEIGTLDLKIYIAKYKHYQGNFVIRRTSAESEYKIWEDVKIIQFISNGNNKNTVEETLDEITYDTFTWSDRTIESGMYYKYGLAPLQANGWRGNFIFTQNSEMCIFDDIFLMSNNKQLRVRYNPTISNFKYNVTESVHTTLGEKYPYVKRNGHNYYRTFSIGGLITTYMDATTESMVNMKQISLGLDNRISTQFTPPHKTLFGDFNADEKSEELKEFTSKDQLFNFDKSFENEQSPKNKIEIYNKENDIDHYEDVVYQREFREKVYDFLYENTVKLFRSNTEGNILIKLTDITFSPMDQLGRQLYSFSAEAVEIAEYSIYNCDKYNIQNIGEYKSIVTLEQVPGQFIKTYSKGIETANIFEDIIKKFKKDWKYSYINQVKSKYAPPQLNQYYSISIPYLTKLRIEISSPPYPIVFTENGYTYMDANSTTSFAILGYIMKLNNNTIIIKGNQQRRYTNKIAENEEYDGLTQSLKNMTYNSVYEIYDKEICVGELNKQQALTFISPPGLPLTVQVDYVAHIEATLVEPSPIAAEYFKNQGQLWGTFNPNQKLIQEIQKKTYNYYQNKESVKATDNNKNKTTQIQKEIDTYRYLQQITAINFDTIPNAVIYLNTTNHMETGGNNLITNYSRHIAANGFINFNSNNVIIKDCYFHGIHLVPPVGNRDPRDDEYKIDNSNIVYNTIDEISNPKNNYVYNVMSFELITNQHDTTIEIEPSSYQAEETLILQSTLRYYIYYHSKWYLFDNDNQDVLCPVDAIINYVYDGAVVQYQNIDIER